jgi:hypothetical protein
LSASELVQFVPLSKLKAAAENVLKNTGRKREKPSQKEKSKSLKRSNLKCLKNQNQNFAVKKAKTLKRKGLSLSSHHHFGLFHNPLDKRADSPTWKNNFNFQIWKVLGKIRENIKKYWEPITSLSSLFLRFKMELPKLLNLNWEITKRFGEWDPTLNLKLGED